MTLNGGLGKVLNRRSAEIELKKISNKYKSNPNITDIRIKSLGMYQDKTDLYGHRQVEKFDIVFNERRDEE